MLRFARREAAGRWPHKRLMARIMPGNDVSIHLFESAGFRLAKDMGDHLLYVLQAPGSDQP